MVPDDLGPIRHALEFEILFVERAVALITHQKRASSNRYSIDGRASDVEVRKAERIWPSGVINARNAHLRCQLLGLIWSGDEHSVLCHAKSKVCEQGGAKGIIHAGNAVLISSIRSSLETNVAELLSARDLQGSRTAQEVTAVAVPPKISALNSDHSQFGSQAGCY